MEPSVYLYQILDEQAERLEQGTSFTYLEAIAKIGNGLFTGEAPRQLDATAFRKVYEQFKQQQWLPEDVRKAFRLACLKGMKGQVQAHHEMTPDSVGFYMSYLVNKCMSNREEACELLDIAAGAGNLLFTICNHAASPVHASGIEVDETLLHIAYASANLQQREVSLLHQDSLKVTMPAVDMVVSDLPVGYYPDDDHAKTYRLAADKGRSYVHHLFIEQSIRMLKPAGYAVLLVPNHLFTSEQAPKLHRFLKEEALVLALLQLPTSMFQSEQHGKSILLLQKKTTGTRIPRQALLAELPSFTNEEALKQMTQRMNVWFAEQLGIE
ncbi:class I SAM-dependent methyltransferase [Shouchella lonarensis]|uniref:Site-specific DNA-methyltransferase (Adenine-specific) n=1 Tax=Shouchella lonarensis TaxID=1464122 RepID=A0A1G6GMX4_9BACI|nr:class I SAM-dependent methyltransferase [Shouchella lonarensis]SDB83298.1 site-specific DNA-methyltransferase (adenine-specific) [Shouchella lonarensis]